jgi:hypothetical protein
MLSELTFNVFAMITDQVDCAHRARLFNAPRPHDPQAVATFEALRPYVPSLLATWPAQPPVVRRGLIGLAVAFPQAGMALYAELIAFASEMSGTREGLLAEITCRFFEGDLKQAMALCMVVNSWDDYWMLHDDEWWQLASLYPDLDEADAVTLIQHIVAF